MASFISSNDPGANIVVTKEEFNLFHNIDRQLFFRLVVGLARDTSQSTHVVAFIMWLEKLTKNSIVASLLPWPDSLLGDVADESVLALNCIESPHFPYVGSTDNKALLPLIQKITRSTVSLKYFHEKRINIIPGVTKILNDVCLRAFTDIVHQVHYYKAMKEQNLNTANANYYAPVQPNPYVQTQVVYYTPVPAGVSVVPQQMVVTQPWNEGSSNWVGAAEGYNVQNKNEFNLEFHEILANLKISDDAERNDVLPPHDRTIFMTFSKGYPISETEVRQFFARRYGDIIESVFMQEVQPNEQPLYARLVVRPEAINMIDGLLDGTSRVKFSINGKHVWARRYFRKGNKSPASASSPVTSGPPSSPFGAY